MQDLSAAMVAMDCLVDQKLTRLVSHNQKSRTKGSSRGHKSVGEVLE